MKSPKQIIDIMMSSDAFSNWLGIEVLEISLGYCKLRCIIKDEMLNGFQIAHGGIAYSLADSALAFASNSRGNQCFSIETSISHVAKVSLGDQLTVICTELHRGKTTGIYEVFIENQDVKTVAHFKGTVLVTANLW
jgi:acyl-CoA thioesterase